MTDEEKAAKEKEAKEAKEKEAKEAKEAKEKEERERKEKEEDRITRGDVRRAVREALEETSDDNDLDLDEAPDAWRDDVVDLDDHRRRRRAQIDVWAIVPLVLLLAFVVVAQLVKQGKVKVPSWMIVAK